MGDMASNALTKEEAERFRQGKATEQLWISRRSSPDDLREQGMTVAIHNDYRSGDMDYTFWLMTLGDKVYKGEGTSDMEALDIIRAKYAEDTDKRHHAPKCPANHWHGTRAPLGMCSCGAKP